MNANILVVDDDSSALKLLNDILSPIYTQVRLFNNAELALRSVNTETPDLMLLDIRMPGMNGFEVCRRFKTIEQLSEIPVLFISAANDPEDKARAFKEGGVDYISKPFQQEEITARVATHLALSNKLMRMKGVTEQLLKDLEYQKYALDQHAIVAITDPNGAITYVNDKFCATSKYSRNELLGQNFRLLNSGMHPESFFQDMYHTITAGNVWHGDFCNRAKDGQLYWVNTTIVPYMGKDGKLFQYITIRTDITERKLAEEKIKQLAYFDVLTGLPNRRLLIDRLNMAIAASVRNGQYGAVIFLDLDCFKALNDTKGHDIGDLLLIEMANRLQNCVRNIDTVARLGGDEFVVVMCGLGREKAEAASAVEQVKEKIRTALNQPYQLKDHKHYSTASLGLYLFQGNNQSADDLLNAADKMMYLAKIQARSETRS